MESLQLLHVLKRAFLNNISWLKASQTCRYRFETLGVCEFRPEFKVTAHSHKNYEVGLALHGTGELVFGGDLKRLEPGGLYLIEPGTTHRLSASPNEAFSALIITITPEPFLPESAAEPIPGISSSRLLDASGIEKIVFARAELIRVKMPDPVSLSLFVRYLGFEMLTLLSHGNSPDAWSLTDRAIRYIEDLLPGKLDLTSMAPDLGASERTLRRHFQKEQGKSISEYLGERRMVLAERYLSLHLAVSDVARMVGFESTSQLSRLFQKQKGITPKGWQKTIAPTRRIVRPKC
ncbi:MAG: AraC family transcriptional regulator [Verrucomicrobia bacterium]|nr:AraC family transcriptional regulator [Verrucomicrobiota bacterium]MDA1068682.1 AraC family transcriptional regulator [Verrucomicrobiota bacterium]